MGRRTTKVPFVDDRHIQYKAPVARLEATCAMLRLLGVHGRVHRDDVNELTPEALDALAALLRSYGFDLGRPIHIQQLRDRVLLTQ